MRYVTIRTGEPALPYQVTAHTHSGEEIILIHRLERHGRSGMISRNMDDLLLRLYLKDEDGKERYQYSCQCALSDFCPKEYEEIQEIYGEHILQADTDDIVEHEVKFFCMGQTHGLVLCDRPRIPEREDALSWKRRDLRFRG